MTTDTTAWAVSDRLAALCTSADSVSSLLAADPTLAPGEAWKRLYGDHAGRVALALEQAARCGKWGPTRPSDLFLHMYDAALRTLEDTPAPAMVSPSLMGSCGVVRLTVISVIPDIVRHMAKVMVRAEREVFLATNYWQDSVASGFLTEAMRELDRRAGQRGARVVLKVLYDRGSPKQLLTPHCAVGEAEFTGPNVKLPRPGEMPNVDMEVINFHQPLLGTFHAKYMVVDGRIALLQSNNIQDNDNLEMMVHLEGPIVEAVRDMALLSWHKPMRRPMPSQHAPPTAAGPEEEEEEEEEEGEDDLGPHEAGAPRYDADIAGEVARVQASVSPAAGLTRMQAVTRLLNHTTNVGFGGDAPECAAGDEMTPYIAHAAAAPVPMALVCRGPCGRPTHGSVANPQNAAWLAALRHAQKSVFIQTPTLNAEPLLPAMVEACERGVDVYCYVCIGYNDAGELLPRQGGHNEMVAHKLHQALSAAGRQHLHYFWYVAKDQTRPIVQERKRRSCHIKLLIADEHVGVQGSGNQDTQSWFHSQEVNVMVDSAPVCAAWRDGLRRNQNTAAYGALDRAAGVWRDGEGRGVEGAIGLDPGPFAWAKGIVAAVKRLRGTGGF
ncbi:hypothetical protein P8C59_000988 [Phyllachora maydis]|uniref:PLD phosphodiesterase domain-containing protein n=1 Tax=Phyllachora maydis TaxID=1825666 RepID=A0AAD9M9P1_9PEZI|nr:hypothetical protein P8C59_000988 [Phyllachora maydis]